MRIAPCGAALQLVEYLWASFGAGFIGKFIPQIFNKLQAFKLAKVFQRVECSSHDSNLSVLSSFMVWMFRLWGKW